MFKQRVQRFIERNALFALEDKVLVALSGGADSVALLRVLLALGFRCECAHCNFHLRGEESERDEAFARQLCEEVQVPFHCIHFDTENHARQHRLSIEMAARELRYAWFEELRMQTGAEVIAVAHHRDDNVETVLLNLIRGTGINGLKGMEPKRGRVVRPLLDESRGSIEEYLRVMGQKYVTDSTNLQDEYMRNKIRLNILPMMRELNPSVSESIQETIGRLAEVARIYRNDRAEVLARCMEKEEDGACCIRIGDIRKDTAPVSLLHEALSGYGFSVGQVEDIWRNVSEGQSGKRFFAADWELLRDRELLVVKRKDVQAEVPELRVEERLVTPDFVIPRDKATACIDADKVTMPLRVRLWKQGDRFVPLGMKGKKKVSDYLTDRKFSLHDKENQYVVCCGEEIVWLVNERTDHRFRVTERTQRVLLLSMIKGGK